MNTYDLAEVNLKTNVVIYVTLYFLGRISLLLFRLMSWWKMVIFSRMLQNEGCTGILTNGPTLVGYRTAADSFQQLLSWAFLLDSLQLHSIVFISSSIVLLYVPAGFPLPLCSQLSHSLFPHHILSSTQMFQVSKSLSSDCFIHIFYFCFRF